MPTKVFTILDATLFSQAITGGVAVSNGPSPTIESLTSLIQIGSWDFLADFNGTMVGAFASVVTTGVSRIEQLIDIDYTKVLTGLPTGSKIKKMVINTPYSININILVDNFYSAISIGASGSITTIVNGITKFISPGSGGGTGGPPSTSYIWVGSALAGSAAADHVVFDLTGGATFITRENFIISYKRITFRNNIFMNSIVNNTGGATNVDSIYVSSLIPGWTVTVTYEASPIQFELNPKIKNEENPEDTVYYITEANNDGVDIPLDTITDLFAYYDVVGPIEITWAIIDNEIVFTLPIAIPANEDVVITATGTQFSGEVEVQYIYAILVNGSGLYKLIPNQKYDRYYNRAEISSETIDLAIPTPKFKTGYFGG